MFYTAQLTLGHMCKDTQYHTLIIVVPCCMILRVLLIDKNRSHLNHNTSLGRNDKGL